MTDERLNIVQSLPRYETIPGHYAPAAIYLSGEDHPGVTFRVAAVDASELIDKPVSDLHTHDGDEIYLVPGPGLQFVVETDRGVVELCSPASVTVPAGVPHRFVAKRAETSPCLFLGLLLDSA